MSWSRIRGCCFAATAACALAVPAQAQDLIIQAENFNAGSQWTSVADSAASGGFYAYANSNQLPIADAIANTLATYDVNVPDTDTRSLYARILVPTSGEAGDEAFNNDSMFFPAEYNADPVAPHVNNTSGPIGGANVWGWLNITAGVGFDGPDPGPTFTAAAAGLQDFRVAGREDGLLVDAYVLSTDAALSGGQLDVIAGIIPEPTAIATLLIGVAGLAARRRGNRA